MTEGIYDIRDYREATWMELLRQREERIKEIAARQMLETNKGGQHGNNDEPA